MSILPESYINKKGMWIYVDTENVKLIPLREIEIINIKEAGGIISVKLKLGRYVSFPEINSSDFKKQFTYAFESYFGPKNIPPGGKYLLLGESFFDLSEYADTGLIKASPSQAFPTFKIEGKAEIGHEFQQFHSIVPCLISDKKMKHSVFYRIEPNNIHQIQENGEVVYTVMSGDSFSIKIEYYLPN
jgi:hypothetical protein